MSTVQTRFPYFWEIQAPPGADGWERMYPPYLVAQEENRAEDDASFLVQAAMHHPRAVFPFDTVCIEGISLAAGQNNTRVFAVPGAMGMRERISNGYRYLSPVEVTDPEEVGRRVAHFQERAGHYYANWDQLSAEWKEKAVANIRATAEIPVKPLPELEELGVVTGGRGFSSGYELLSAYNRLIDNFFLMWQYHFEMANIAHAAFGAFSHFCMVAFPGISPQTLARMVGGQDLILYRPDDELKNLARRAIDLGIAETVLAAGETHDPLGGIGDSEAGREWIASLDEIKDPWFYYAEGGNLYHDAQIWIDDLSLPLAGIKSYIERLQRGEDVSRPGERLRAEADELIAEQRTRLDGEELAKFDQLLGIAKTVLPFTQDHSFYGEHWFLSVFWRKMRGLGEALTERGMFARADDLFYLTRHEVSMALWDAVHSWAIGTEPTRGRYWRSKVARRREIMEILEASQPVPAVGEPPEQITNPLLISHVGITSEVVARWLNPDTASADSLSGAAASTGVVEGVCRVVQSASEIDTVEEGEILVCQTTTPSWGPVFSRLSGLVSDTGGMMSHSAVVAREYGIPAVVGCSGATRTLHTGDTIRLDGDQGKVTVLDSDRKVSA